MFYEFQSKEIIRIDEKALRGDANTARWLQKGGPTNKHTDMGDYNTLRSVARSVITLYMQKEVYRPKQRRKKLGACLY